MRSLGIPGGGVGGRNTTWPPYIYQYAPLTGIRVRGNREKHKIADTIAYISWEGPDSSELMVYDVGVFLGTCGNHSEN